MNSLHASTALDAQVPTAVEGFDAALLAHALPLLRRDATRTLQVNLGKRCNMTCQHCHVDAGPTRTEMMSRATAERVLALLDRSPGVRTLDLTGGAPELNPCFRWLVTQARQRGLRVIDRCNLTVLLEPGQEDLAQFLADQAVEIVASLPCYLSDNVERQRGRGVFDRSVEALQRLCTLGYGASDGSRLLDLVYNPVGPALPPAQAGLQARYRSELGERFGIQFNNLLTITNMPIARFGRALERAGGALAYQALLVSAFNPETVPGLMCRSLVSVGWDGRLYDCDFNQMLDLGPPGAAPQTIWELDAIETLVGHRVATGPHCFGCTAGAGSSCSGALA